LGGAWFRRKEVESAAAVGLCCTHNACALPERKMSSVMFLIASDFVEIVRYPIGPFTYYITHEGWEGG